jgi:hypothetical protein
MSQPERFASEQEAAPGFEVPVLGASRRQAVPVTVVVRAQPPVGAAAPEGATLAA